jgi:hypothetical protein
MLHHFSLAVLPASRLLQSNKSRQGGYTKAMFNTASCMLVPTALKDLTTGSDPSIYFAVTLRILPSKEYKINKRTCDGQE